MSITVIGNTESEINLVLYKDYYRLDLDVIKGGTLPNETSPMPNDYVVDSEKLKIVLPIPQGPYHFLNDLFGIFLQAKEKYPDAEYIFYASDHVIGEEIDLSYNKFFFDFIKSENINYTLIDGSKYNAIFCNNFYIAGPYLWISDAPSRTLDFFVNYFNENIVPNKKVYLSRKSYSFFTKYNSRSSSGVDYNRLDNPELLEEYFKSMGFEVIDPENFESFEDQAKYFMQVKTLVSLSGSGLANSFFMIPGSTVIELMTPIIISPDINQQYFIESLHHFHHTSALQKQMIYVSVPNLNRSSADLIEKLDKENIKRLLEN